MYKKEGVDPLEANQGFSLQFDDSVAGYVLITSSFKFRHVYRLMAQLILIDAKSYLIPQC
jgi:hypothetical protein